MSSLDQIAKWNQRYREGHDDLPAPLPFLVDAVSLLPPGRALDLACGTGRHAIWLAERGWNVTAIDGSEVAIEALLGRGVPVDARVEDIEAADFRIPAGPYDLIVDTFFLHRPLFPQIREALRPGGVAVLAFHLTGSFSIQRDELDDYFKDWVRLHYHLHDEIPTVELVVLSPGINIISIDN